MREFCTREISRKARLVASFKARAILREIPREGTENVNILEIYPSFPHRSHDPRDADDGGREFALGSRIL